jgi:hypothetical protein
MMQQGVCMTEPVQQEHDPVFSKRAAYGLSAGAVLGTATLAVTSPQTLAAGVGSVGMSSAVFVTPVWRFIKRVNDMYTDISMYLGADWEMMRGKHFGPPSHEKREALAKHKPTFTRASAYGVLGASALTSGFLFMYAPSVLFAAFGSVIVSGASFTTPVIDLVRKVNELYVDTYNYVKGDISKTKKLKVKPLVNDTNHEIDKSIYAPVEQKRKYSKKATYAILAGAAVVGGLIALGAPSLLVAAAGTIIGSAVSYTAPALKFVKKVNHVYDKTEDHIIEDLDIADKLGPRSQPSLPGSKPAAGDDQALHITKPMAYMIAAGALLGGAAVVIYAPQLITAAIGGILGSASSFTTPVLKQVGKVNAFYIDACQYMKEDWGRVFKPAAPVSQFKTGVDNVAATANPGGPKVESPKQEFNTVAAPVEPKETPKPSVDVDFNTSAQRPTVIVNDNKPAPEVAQPAATVQKPKQPGNPGL